MNTEVLATRKCEKKIDENVKKKQKNFIQGLKISKNQKEEWQH